MNLVEESEADCLTTLDNLLPLMLLVSFIFGFVALNYFKKRIPDHTDKKPKIILLGAKFENPFEEKDFE